MLSQLSYTPPKLRIEAYFGFYLSFCIAFRPSKLHRKRFSQSLWVCEVSFALHLRKEVIQPHLPIRLPCYDFTLVIDLTFDSSLLKG